MEEEKEKGNKKKQEKFKQRERKLKHGGNRKNRGKIRLKEDTKIKGLVVYVREWVKK